jgi:hypothetical protein
MLYTHVAVRYGMPNHSSSPSEQKPLVLLLAGELAVACDY